MDNQITVALPPFFAKQSRSDQENYALTINHRVAKVRAALNAQNPINGFSLLHDDRVNVYHLDVRLTHLN